MMMIMMILLFKCQTVIDLIERQYTNLKTWLNEMNESKIKQKSDTFKSKIWF